jgi:hypothetical protein
MSSDKEGVRTLSYPKSLTISRWRRVSRIIRVSRRMRRMIQDE